VSVDQTVLEATKQLLRFLCHVKWQHCRCGEAEQLKRLPTLRNLPLLREEAMHQNKTSERTRPRLR